MVRHPDITAHRLIADLCVNMAEEIYEELAYRNSFFRIHEDRQDFIKQCAPTLKTEAKRILASLLDDPETSEMQKRDIYQALLLDNQLPKHGTSVVKKGMH